MSVEAITWALAQPVASSSAKFVLVVMANCSNGSGMVAWPSVAHLCEATGQDRKTVMSNIAKLRESGFIEDTGDRQGATRQIVVYRLKATEIGTVKESQERNGSDNGTVPVFPAKSPVFPSKESQFSAKESQKRDTEPEEPEGNRKGTGKRVADPLPDWLDHDTWADWVKYRGRKFTTHAQNLSLKTLTKLRDAGEAPQAVIEQSIERGWTSLYALKSNTQQARASPGTLTAAEKRSRTMAALTGQTPPDYVDVIATERRFTLVN